MIDTNQLKSATDNMRRSIKGFRICPAEQAMSELASCLEDVADCFDAVADVLDQCASADDLGNMETDLERIEDDVTRLTTAQVERETTGPDAGE